MALAWCQPFLSGLYTVDKRSRFGDKGEKQRSIWPKFLSLNSFF